MPKPNNYLSPVILVALSAFYTYPVRAAEEIRTECVGRFTVSLPVTSDFLLTPRHYFLYLDKAQSQYPDNHPAIISNPADFIRVSAPTTLEDFNALHGEISDLQKDYRKHIKLGATDVVAMSEYPVDIPNTFAWREDGSEAIFIYMYRAGRMFLHTVDAGKGFSEAEAAHKTQSELVDSKLAEFRLSDFLKRFRAREIFEIPKEPGVCFPYGFIADADDSVPKLHQDESIDSSVPVDMQLIDHLDISISFEYGVKGNSNFSVGGQLPPTTQIWRSRFAYDTGAIRLEVPFYRNLIIGGWPGQWGFAKMTHFDKTTDYGYAAAAVNEDKTSPEFEDSLSLIVVRHAARAKGKPVSKGELNELAEKIATSITRR